ncbi:MAG: NADP-dependent isocitrate dehydrogenase [Ruminococcaceae bacterium]|nr:NADP-dependent isocitrate dehydrogenase [Oscillospiraceae bacterium]
MDKIKMITPLVEMDGDEMTRIIWQMIKDELILPFVDLKTEYYDLGLPNREATKDQVTKDAAAANAKYGVAVKCATITPNSGRMTEYNLTQMWKSPNGTIRTHLDGTVFRAPILVNGISPVIPAWQKPITIARHAYADIYKAVDATANPGDVLKLTSVAADGSVTEKTVYEFECPGVMLSQYNKDTSIENFARACFNYALDTCQDLWFSAKDTIIQSYDGRFRDIFQNLYDTEYKQKFEAKGLEYVYTLIDDAVARCIRSKGGFIWALKNYDGDVMSDMVSAAFGSLAMMTSVLVNPKGVYEYEAAHGTVTRHYYRYLKGEETSTNPMATIFAWSGALHKRGEKDSLPELMAFADKLEAASLTVIQSGIMTGDLAAMYTGGDAKAVTTKEFIIEIKNVLSKAL